MYTDLGAWFHLVTSPADYADEAAEVRELVRQTCDAPARTLLELGSGGGNNASHLKAWFELTLVDPAPEMLRLSRDLNPECEHVEGDMRTLRLGRRFDAVLIHDAIGYMTTERDLEAALRTAVEHCRPGGAVVLQPDVVRETFEPGTEHGGHDGPDGRGLRYLEWDFDPDPADTTFRTAYAFILREPDGSLRVERDEHELGMFPRATWLRILAALDLEARVVTDRWEREVFVCRKPTTSSPTAPSRSPR